MKFAASVKTYNENAIVQKECAKKLIKLLVKYAGRNFGQIFEIGCLTGILTEVIKSDLNFKKLFLNDLVDITKNENGFIFHSDFVNDKSFILGDIEKIPLKNLPRNNNLIISNACFQWFKNFEQTILKLNKTLDKNGVIAFSTFGKNNFKTFKSLTGIGLDYPEVKSFLEKNFNILFYMEEKINLEFKSPRMLLKHIQKTGAGGLSNGKWSKSALKNFEQNLKSPYVLEYNPIYCIAKSF